MALDIGCSKTGIADSDVGRNKATQAKREVAFPASLGVFAGKASAPAHAPYLHPCRQRRFSLSLEPAYSGLLRDVYNDERSGVGTHFATLQRCHS